MHTRKVHRYFVLPLLYVAIVFGLLYIQFSGALTVRRSYGDLRFSATLALGEDETSSNIIAARAEFNGIAFELSESEPVHLLQGGQVEQRLSPTKYQAGRDRIVVTLQDGSTIAFELVDPEGTTLHLVAEPGTDWPQPGTLSIPYRVTDKAVTDIGSGTTSETISVRYDDRVFFLSPPPRSGFDQVAGRVVVPFNGGSQIIRYAEARTGRSNTIEVSFAEGQRRVSDEAYDELLGSYIDQAYEGWSDLRYNGGSGTWDTRDGTPRFSDEIVRAYLAEAWTRNEFDTAYARVRRAADLHASQVGFRSMAFLGNMRGVTSRVLASDRERAVEIERRLADADATVFQQLDVIQFAALRADEALYRQVRDAVAEVDVRVVDLRSAIGMLWQATGARLPQSELYGELARFHDIGEQRILPAIRRLGDEFYVEIAEGEIDTRYSLLAGVALDRLGQQEGDELLPAVGRNLVTAVLGLADARGFIPGRVFFSDQGFTGQDGSYGAEAIYPLLVDNPAYPRLISLYDDLGAGAYMLTVVDVPVIDVSAKRHRYVLRYPFERTHYILLQGIDPFARMELFGLVWRNDPSFERYRKGRHYERATESLMIKYNDPTTEGDIVIEY